MESLIVGTHTTLKSRRPLPRRAVLGLRRARQRIALPSLFSHAPSNTLYFITAPTVMLLDSLVRNEKILDGIREFTKLSTREHLISDYHKLLIIKAKRHQAKQELDI